MPKPDGEPRHDEAFWYDFLSRGDSNERRVRPALKRLPASPLIGSRKRRRAVWHAAVVSGLLAGSPAARLPAEVGG